MTAYQIYIKYIYVAVKSNEKISTYLDLKSKFSSLLENKYTGGKVFSNTQMIWKINLGVPNVRTQKHQEIS